MKKEIAAIVVVVVGAATFWAGTLYQSRQFAVRFGDGPAMMGGRMIGGRGQGAWPGGGQGRPGGRAAGERLLSGRLDNIDDNRLTLTTNFGSIKVNVDKKAKVTTTQEGKAADLKAGKQVIIDGKPDEEGRWTAEAIIIK